MNDLSAIMRGIDGNLIAALHDLDELTTALPIPIGEALRLAQAAGEIRMALRSIRQCAESLHAANVEYYRIDLPVVEPVTDSDILDERVFTSISHTPVIHHGQDQEPE